MIEPISINAFSGMNNVKKSERFSSEEGVAEPRIILNADALIEGSLLARDGTALIFVTTKGGSLWAGVNCSLFVDNGYLKRFTPPTAVTIGAINDRGYPVDFVDAENKVYFSNPYYQGIFDPATNTVSDWGVLPPSGPMLLSGSGSLSAGVYHVTMTSSVGDEISGTGPISSITLSADGGAITVLNRPSGSIVWCTDANEYIFYRIGETSKIDAITTVEPCPSLMCSPPPYLSNLCYAFGRIWGSNGSTVYYSEPFKLGWFRTSANRFEFEDEVTLIAKVPTGLFIGMRNKTRFYAGTEPEKMRVSDAGAGSIPGTLAYVNNMPELGDVLGTPEKGYVDVPVWRTTEGIVAGNALGRLYNLTKNKLIFGTPERGASLYRNFGGVLQILTSSKVGSGGSGAGFFDADTIAAIKAGKFDIFSLKSNAIGSGAVASETVTCELYRGGVLVP